jgi:hypothetical protein
MCQRTEIMPQEVPAVRKIQELRQQQKQNTFITLVNDQLDAQIAQMHFFFNLCTGRPLTDSDDTRRCINPYPANVVNIVSS